MDWDVKIYYASRETHRGTNVLTTMRCEGDFSLMSYERILVQINLFLLSDCNRVLTPRLISM